MADSVYDVVKLEKLDAIDVKTATKCFSGNQAYFDELDIFINESKHYLRGYTSSVVIYNEDVRKNFLDESTKIKGKLVSLGMTDLASAISELDYAAGSDSAETLSDWLLRFYAQIDNMVKLIGSARTSGKTAGQNIEKPVILAVDDKPELLTAIVNILEGKFKVIAVTSGKAALNVIEKYTPKLFLLDIEMPQMNGYELAKAIRKHKRFESSPVIFLTGKNTRDDVVMGIKNGGNDYLLKPVEKELLIDKIRRHLEGCD